MAALTNKIEELELRRQKDKAKEQLDQSKKKRIADRGTANISWKTYVKQIST